jgi:pimeloyl-ACP methyl ester carboxylesterase
LRGSEYKVLIARVWLGYGRVGFDVDLTFSFGGFKYHGRLVDQPTPSMAPVLLLGGAFQDRYSWARHEARLAPLATTVTVDLPGSGAADPLPASYGLEFLADAVAHMVTELGLPPMNVMGGSYGGTVAYRLAQRHPARVRRLLLCGTALRIPEAIRAHARDSIDLFRAGDRDGFVRSTIALFLCADPAATIHKRPAVTRLLERQLRTLTPDQADKYVSNTERVLACTTRDIGAPPTGPLLVVTGEYDTLTTPAMCRATADRCPDAGFTTIRYADHLLPLQRADEFADLMARYFGEQPIDDLPYCNPLESLTDHQPA